MSDENIRLEYWQCEKCNALYHIDPLNTNYLVDAEGQVHCAKDKIPMVKLKRKPAKQVPNIGLTNTLILRQMAVVLSNYFEKKKMPFVTSRFEYFMEQLDYSAQWQVKNRRLLDIVDELELALINGKELKDFWKSKYLDVEFEV